MAPHIFVASNHCNTTLAVTGLLAQLCVLPFVCANHGLWGRLGAMFALWTVVNSRLRGHILGGAHFTLVQSTLAGQGKERDYGEWDHRDLIYIEMPHLC